MDESWKDVQKRTLIHYADLDCIAAFNPDSDLAPSVPESCDYDFGHGHCGVLLDESTAALLRDLIRKKRKECIDMKIKAGTYIPRSIPSCISVPHSEERIYLNSSRKKLVEGYVRNIGFEGSPDRYDIAVAVDKSRLWDTFWSISSKLFNAEEHVFVISVRGMKMLIVQNDPPVSEILEKMKPFRDIFEDDGLITFCFSGPGGMAVMRTEEGEIIVNYNDRTEIIDYIESLGFKENNDAFLFFNYDKEAFTTHSVFGESFPENEYIKIGRAVGAVMVRFH